MLSFCLFCCGKKKYRYVACFTTEKEVYSVGEEILFENCSDFIGEKEGYKSGVQWVMGDGTIKYSFNNESITYAYTSPGVYAVNLLIGKKEGPQSEIEKTITIIE